MNIDEFVKKDMTEFLESMSASRKENSKAGAAEIDALLSGSQQSALARQSQEQQSLNASYVMNVTNATFQQSNATMTANNTSQATPTTRLQPEKEEQEQAKSSPETTEYNKQTQPNKTNITTANDKQETTEKTTQATQKRYQESDEQERTPSSRTRKHKDEFKQQMKQRRKRSLKEIEASIHTLESLISEQKYFKALEEYRITRYDFLRINERSDLTNKIYERLKGIAKELDKRLVSSKKIRSVLYEEIKQGERRRTIEQEYKTSVEKEQAYQEAEQAIEGREKQRALKLLLELSREYKHNNKIHEQLKKALNIND
ncbi:MAG: hypothetical protein ACOCU6_00250 [Nanoarchaeota archaeon]